MTLYERLRQAEVSSTEKESLIAKCQENGWLRRGGYEWQDDPYMEEYPYSFVRTESMEDLREFFAHGNWAIRQGILYHDLAFIQQVNGDDEWWTLKRLGDGGWLAFESWTFGGISEDARRFSEAIVSMEMATPEECRRLVYMLPESDLKWSSEYVSGIDGEREPVFRASRDGLDVTVRRADDGRFELAMEDGRFPGRPDVSDGFENALEAGIFCCNQLGFGFKEQMREKGPRQELLDQRASRLREAAMRFEKDNAARERNVQEASNRRPQRA